MLSEISRDLIPQDGLLVVDAFDQRVDDVRRRKKSRIVSALLDSHSCAFSVDIVHGLVRFRPIESVNENVHETRFFF